MASEPSWEDIFSPEQSASDAVAADSASGPEADRPADTPEDAPRTRRELRERASSSKGRGSSGRGGGGRRDGMPPRPRRRFVWLWVLMVFVLLIGAGTALAWVNFEPQIRHVMGWEEPNDYVGSGTGKVVITIKDGQIGADVAKTLHDAGVTKSVAAFYSLLLKQDPPVSFQPGSYALKAKMSAKAALTALEDPENKVLTRVVLPEGITVAGVIKRLAAVSQATGVTEEELKAAAADYASYGLPKQAPSLEGYLFPATYSLDPGLSAHQIFEKMVKEMFSRLDAAGVPVEDRHRVLTLASMTQKEGGNTKDFYKVARVWENRLTIGMDLQSDATVRYGAGGSKIATTDAERADKSNPYNTYANPGLPVGPISNPGEAAIDATLHPASGPWLFFVLVNGETGETVFSATEDEHYAAVKKWQAWLRAHPGFDG